MKQIFAKVLGCVCLALFVGVVAAGPAAAAGEEVEFETQAMSECPYGYICFWSGKTFGRAECEAGQNCYSQFAGGETGWHNLENINPQSMYNHTDHRYAWFPIGPFGNGYTINPGETNQWSSPYTGGFSQS